MVSERLKRARAVDFQGGALNGVRQAIPVDYPVGVPLRMDSYFGEVVYTLTDAGIMEPAEGGESDERPNLR